MSDQEIVATAETQTETSTLFDELAGLVPGGTSDSVLQGHRAHAYAQPKR